MGFTPVHQRRCSTGPRSNEAPTSAGLRYLQLVRHRLATRPPADDRSEGAHPLSEIRGHVEGAAPESPALTSGADSRYCEKQSVRSGRGKCWSYS